MKVINEPQQPQQAGWLNDEIIPVTIKSRKGEAVVQQDEGPRNDCLLESMAKLRPAFDPAGTITAGNASQISDGAAALIVADQTTAEKSKTPLKARIVAAATAGVDPKEIFIAPVDAINSVLKKADMHA